MKAVAVKYGVLVGLGSFVWLLAEYFLGFRTDNFDYHLRTGPFSILILICGVALAINATKVVRGGRLTFNEAFWTGMTVAFIAGVVMVVGQYIYLNLIDPEYINRARTWSIYIQALDGVPGYEALENARNNAWRYNEHVRAFGQIPQFLLQGSIVSAGASAIMTRKKRRG